MNYRVPTFTKANSLPLDEAGELMRLSYARLVEAKAGIQAWRVAGAVWGLTVPYSKGWEAVFVDRLAALTGMDERAVRRGIKECAAADALQWKANRWIPPKGEPGRPSLIGLPGAPKRVSKPSKTGSSQPGHGSVEPGLTEAKTGSSQPDLLSNESLSAELNTHNSTLDIDTGTHRSSPSLSSDSVDGSENWEAERRASLQTRAEPNYDPEELARQLEAELALCPPDCTEDHDAGKVGGLDHWHE